MLPRDLAGREAVQAFERAGWEWTRTRGSHAVLGRKGAAYSLSVPLHDRLDRGTLRGLIRSAGMTVDEFVKYLD